MFTLLYIYLYQDQKSYSRTDFAKRSIFHVKANKQTNKVFFSKYNEI